MKPVLLALAGLAGLAIAGAAQAETWIYYPVPGGAMAYEKEGRRIDLVSGITDGDTLVYYFVPKAIGKDAFSILVQRLQFQCRGDKYRVLNIAYFDAKGDPAGEAEGSDWMPVPAPGASTIPIFKRLVCTDDEPPTAKIVHDRDALMAALRALPPTEARSTQAPPSSITLPSAPPPTTPGL